MIRQATHDDADEIGRVFVASRDEMAYLPPIPAEQRPLVGGWLVERYDIWVAEEERIVGFLGLDGLQVSHLYVEPCAQRQGIGSALLEEAKRLRPARLELWTFQRNQDARRFYERHGFRLVRIGAGAENVEREPEALYEWVASS